MKIDRETHALLKSLAGPKPLKDFVAELAKREKQQRALQTATDTFRRHMDDDTLQAFDAEFGGLPAVAHKPSQAA